MFNNLTRSSIFNQNIKSIIYLRVYLLLLSKPSLIFLLWILLSRGRCLCWFSGSNSFDCWFHRFKFKWLHRVFNNLKIATGWLKELWTSFACHFKPENLRLIVINLGWKDYCQRIVLHKNMRERCPKVCTIDVYLPYLWQINLFAAWTVGLESGSAESVR